MPLRRRRHRPAVGRLVPPSRWGRRRRAGGPASPADRVLLRAWWSCRPRRHLRSPATGGSPVSASTTSRCAGSRWRPATTEPSGARRPAVSVLPARAASRVTRSASTARTGREVRERTWSGTSSRFSSGSHLWTARAVRSSASSRRTAVVATMSTEVMMRSTSPRISAAFQLDRRAPSRVIARSTTASRFTLPIEVPSLVSVLTARSWAGGVNPRPWSSSTHRRRSAVPSLGATLSGRAWDQARRSQAIRSFGPGSWPGFSLRHWAS